MSENMKGKKRSWKKEADYWKRRYEDLRDEKTQTSPSATTEKAIEEEIKLETNDTKTKKEAVKSVKSEETALDNPKENSSDDVDTGSKNEASNNSEPVAPTEPPTDSPTEPPATPPVEDNEEEEEELDIEKEPAEANPDDYKYCCPTCKELFNELKDGKCPDCSEELDGAS